MKRAVMRKKRNQLLKLLLKPLPKLLLRRNLTLMTVMMRVRRRKPLSQQLLPLRLPRRKQTQMTLMTALQMTMRRTPAHPQLRKRNHPRTNPERTKMNP